MDCAFCKINDEQTRIIKAGKTMQVIVSNPRLMKHHTLIIPKRHISKISELSSEEQKELFELLSEFEKKILKFAKGVDLRQNYRPFQGETELKKQHLHFHLQPRELFDELYEKSQKHETDIFKKLTEEEIKETLEKLK